VDSFGLMGDRGYRGCEYVEVCESKEQKGIRQVEERDYLTCLPLWLCYRLQLFQEVSNMGVISHPTYDFINITLTLLLAEYTEAVLKNPL